MKTNWAYDQYRIMQRIVCCFVFAVYSDAHIPSCAKASFLQPLLCQPWRIPCSLSVVLITLSADLSVSCDTSLSENLFFWKSAVVFQLPNGMFAVCHIASLTLYSWQLRHCECRSGLIENRSLAHALSAAVLGSCKTSHPQCPPALPVWSKRTAFSHLPAIFT